MKAPEADRRDLDAGPPELPARHARARGQLDVGLARRAGERLLRGPGGGLAAHRDDGGGPCAALQENPGDPSPTHALPLGPSSARGKGPDVASVEVATQPAGEGAEPEGSGAGGAGGDENGSTSALRVSSQMPTPIVAMQAHWAGVRAK